VSEAATTPTTTTTPPPTTTTPPPTGGVPLEFQMVLVISIGGNLALIVVIVILRNRPRD